MHLCAQGMAGGSSAEHAHTYGATAASWACRSLQQNGNAECVSIWIGYGGRVVAEMDKLKTMARKTEDRRQLGELMALVAEKATVAVAVKPERTESKVSLRHSLLPVPAECCALQGC